MNTKTIICILMSLAALACGHGQHERAIDQARIVTLQRQPDQLEHELEGKTSSQNGALEASGVNKAASENDGPVLFNAPEPNRSIPGFVNLSGIRMKGCGRMCWKIWNGSRDLYLQVYSDGFPVKFYYAGKPLLGLANAYKPGWVREIAQISVIPPGRAGRFMVVGGEGDHEVTVIGYTLTNGAMLETVLPNENVLTMKGQIFLPLGISTHRAWFPYRENEEGAGFRIMSRMSPIRS